MEIKEEKIEYNQNRFGKVIFGLGILAVGILLLVKKMGYEVPDFLFKWEVLLIVIGFTIGLKHKFKHFGWLIPVTIGSAFLAEDYIEGFSVSQFFWPLLLIFVGLMIIFKPKKKYNQEKWRRKFERFQSESWKCQNEGFSSASSLEEEYIDSVSVFGGVKKNIISKNFKGGEISTFFGGADINLMQADIEGKVILEISQVFGGTKLSIPPHWELKSELTAVLGGIEDRRNNTNSLVDSNKTLIIRGSTVFGGIEIS